MSFSLDVPVVFSGAAMSALLTLLKVTCVLVAALALTTAMRRGSAGTRHVVWLVALLAALVLPFVSTWLPVRVRVLPPAPRPVVTTPVPVRTGTPLIARVAPAEHVAPVVPHTSPVARRPIGVGTMLLVLWALGAVALLIRLAMGHWFVRRIVRRARVLEQPDWQRPLYEIADRLGLDDAPRLVRSDRIRMPFATGFLKAVIVLPGESDQWSRERRCAVLIHELAHVKRRDLVGHLVSRFACALYWFHPLVWTAARHLRAESERACDDLALVLGTHASDYAEHLLEIVTDVRADRLPAVALAMAKPSEFEGRMLAILDPRRRRRGPGRVQMTWLVGTLAMLALVVGAVSPARRATATPPEPGGHVRGAPLTRDENADDSKANQPPAADPTGAAYRQDESATDSRSKDKDKDKGKDVASDTVVDREIDREKSGDSETDAVDEAKNAQKAQVLAKALRNDSDAEVRRVAAWGLERYADHEVAAKALAEAVGRDANEDVREMSAWALAESKSPAAITTINAAFRNDKSRKVRQTAAWAAGSIGSPSSVDGLATLLSDTDPDMREVAAWSIGSCSPQRAPAALIKALNDSNRDVRLSAAWALGEIGDASAANEIDAAFRREKDPEVQHGLIRALGSMGDSAIPTLTRLVDSSSPEVRAVAVQALAGGHMSEPWPWPRPEPRPFP